ncbi:MAG: hypothetical protein ABEI74_02225 [Candidatus Pacearchaeota archaeon]
MSFEEYGSKELEILKKHKIQGSYYFYPHVDTRHLLMPKLFIENKKIRSKTEDGIFVHKDNIRDAGITERDKHPYESNMNFYELSDYVIDLPNRAMLEKK